MKNSSLFYRTITLALLSVISLAAAYIAEYGFGLNPCTLCLYQRIPYAVVIGITLLALLCYKQHEWVLLLQLLCAIVFLIGGAIAFYHVGVEHHVFAGLTTCSGHGKTAMTIEEMRQQLIGTPAVRCDVPAFVFLGLSMAGWNMLWSFFLGGVTLLLVANDWRHKKGQLG